MVSVQHAVFLQTGAGALLIDTSLNGSYVNGRRVYRALVRPGDLVRFGKQRQESKSLHAFIFQTHVGVLANPAPSVRPKFDENDYELLLDSLQCFVCKDFCVFPTEISPCSHMFCLQCIDEYSAQPTSCGICPRCSSRSTSYKLTTRFNTVPIFLNILRLVLSETEFQTYLNRHNARKCILQDQQVGLAKLREKASSVSDDPLTGDPFLLISQTWTEYEMIKFQRAISQYPLGEAREFFCWMVRLTPHWVQFDASETDMCIALRNLKLVDTRKTLDGARDCLLRFIFNRPQLG